MAQEWQFEHGAGIVGLIMGYAAEEARRLGHGYIGTEHLLLALLPERKRLRKSKKTQVILWSQIEKIVYAATPQPTEAIDLLADMGVDYRNVRNAIKFMIGTDDKKGLIGPENMVPYAKRAYDLAYMSYIRDTEPRLPMSIYMLYGLLEVRQGVAAGILESLMITRESLEPFAEKYRPTEKPKAA